MVSLKTMHTKKTRIMMTDSAKFAAVHKPPRWTLECDNGHEFPWDSEQVGKPCPVCVARRTGASGGPMSNHGAEIIPTVEQYQRQLEYWQRTLEDICEGLRPGDTWEDLAKRRGFAAFCALEGTTPLPTASSAIGTEQ